MDVSMNNAAGQIKVEQSPHLLHISKAEEGEHKQRVRKLNIKFDLSSAYNNHILPQYKTQIRRDILENVSIADLRRSSEYLKENVESLIRNISDFKQVDLYASEEKLFRQIGAHFQEEAPHKMILIVGTPEFPLPSNFFCVTRLCDLKEYLSQPCRIAALILDPLFFIYRSNYSLHKIEALRKQCFGSGITFILDERKTAARIHLKGLNFIFQFKADAILLGTNLSNGIPFGAVAGTRQFKGNSTPPEAFASSALALMACEKIIEKFQELGDNFHLQLNQRAERFVQIFNNYRPRKKSKIEMLHLGSIIWIKTLSDKVVQSKLHTKGILTSGQHFIFLPTHLNVKDFSDLAYRFAMALKNRPRKYGAGKQNYSNKEQS